MAAIEARKFVEGVGGRLAASKSQTYAKGVLAVEGRNNPFIGKYMLAGDLACVLSAHEIGVTPTEEARTLVRCLVDLLPRAEEMSYTQSIGDIVVSRELWVVEVKSGLADYRVDGKWPDYRDYCDGFLFAVAPEFPREILPEDVGLIVADSYGGELQREPPKHPLAPARRKMLTIAFAKLAAARLALLEDPPGL